LRQFHPCGRPSFSFTVTFTRQSPCSVCKIETTQDVGRTITASRTTVFSWFCAECDRPQIAKSGGIYIPKAVLMEHLPDEAALEQIPIHHINDAPRCERCGQRGAELHHWAPKEIFGEEEAEHWPKDYLCVTCHRDWHGKINHAMRASQ
jgi:fructosamine-3-kinase